MNRRGRFDERCDFRPIGKGGKGAMLDGAETALKVSLIMARRGAMSAPRASGTAAGPDAIPAAKAFDSPVVMIVCEGRTVAMEGPGPRRR